LEKQNIKCPYFTAPDNCGHMNDPYEQGECIYENGIITDKAAFHCSQGKKLLKIEDK
jgi:hypothetical protein